MALLTVLAFAMSIGPVVRAQRFPFADLQRNHPRNLSGISHPGRDHATPYGLPPADIPLQGPTTQSFAPLSDDDVIVVVDGSKLDKIHFDLPEGHDSYWIPDDDRIVVTTHEESEDEGMWMNVYRDKSKHPITQHFGPNGKRRDEGGDGGSGRPDVTNEEILEYYQDYLNAAELQMDEDAGAVTSWRVGDLIPPPEHDGGYYNELGSEDEGSSEEGDWMKKRDGTNSTEQGDVAPIKVKVSEADIKKLGEMYMLHVVWLSPFPSRSLLRSPFLL